MTERPVTELRGWIEWRHPLDSPDVEPTLGWCVAGNASGGLGGWWLCWTPLAINGLGGMHWTRDLSGFTPLGPSARAILDFVRERLDEDRRTLPSDHFLYPRSA